MKKLLALPLVMLAASLAFAPALVAADNHDEVQPDNEGYDEDDANETTELAVSEEDALATALNALSTNEWIVEESEADDGYYEFEFVIDGRDDAEAEVRVSGETGDVVSVEEELETKEQDADETEAEENETNGDDTAENETSEDEESDEKREYTTLEEARERIEELEEQVRELREELKELRSDKERGQDELPEQASDQAREARERRGPPAERPGRGNSERRAEVEAEFEQNGTEVEAEAERRGPPANRGPSAQARENVNGTPGNGSNRPGFVNSMLRAMFG